MVTQSFKIKSIASLFGCPENPRNRAKRKKRKLLTGQLLKEKKKKRYPRRIFDEYTRTTDYIETKKLDFGGAGMRHYKLTRSEQLYVLHVDSS